MKSFLLPSESCLVKIASNIPQLSMLLRVSILFFYVAEWYPMLYGCCMNVQQFIHPQIEKYWGFPVFDEND